jgi:hypothetical protein
MENDGEVVAQLSAGAILVGIALCVVGSWIIWGIGGCFSLSERC